MEFQHQYSDAECKEKVMSLVECLNDNELTKRVEALTKLGNLLSEDPQARDYFHELEGKNVILNRLLIENRRKFVEAALLVLANSTNNHMENQNSLISEYIFDLLYTIIKQPDIMKLQNLSHAAIYLISTIAYQNSAGQHLVRESGCLTQLLNLFHKVLSTAWKIQNPCKEFKSLDIICHALYLSVNNPKNEENQNQVAAGFPKTLLYLSFLIFDNKMRNYYILPCLRLLTGTLSENKVTQEMFLEYGGMIFLRRLLLDKSGILEEESIEMCIILMDLLITSKRFPSSELPASSIITFLVEILQKNKCKLVILLLLYHLMENNLEMQDVFIKCDGPEKMKQVCLMEVENEEIELISAGIWAKILHHNLEVSKGPLCLGPSERDKDLLENENQRNDEEPQAKYHGMDSPKSSGSSSIHTFDMTKNFEKRLPRAYKKMYRNTDLQCIHENMSSVSSPIKNNAIDTNRGSDASKVSKLSTEFNIKAGFKRKQEPPCVTYLKDENIIDDESVVLYATNLSSVDNIAADVKRNFELPCMDFEMDEKMKDGVDAGQTLKPMQANDVMPGVKRKETISCEGLEKDKKIKDDRIANECIPNVPSTLNDLLDTPNSKNYYCSNRCTDVIPSGNKFETSGLPNIPLQINNLASNVNVEILKTPTGFQINLNSYRKNEFSNTAKRSRTHCSKAQTSQIENNHYAIKDKVIELSGNVKPIKNNEYDILNYKNNCMEISKPDLINVKSQTDSSVLLLSHKNKEIDYKTLDYETRCKISSEKSMEKESISSTQTHRNSDIKDRKVENGIFCPIMPLESQEINSEIGSCDQHKHTAQNGVTKHSKEAKNSGFHNSAEGTESGKLNIDKVKKSSPNFKKEMMIPRGQRNRWKAQKGSLLQIPFTRLEIENLNAGIKEFGLNFIDIRKNYSFLSTRTSKDLFVAWRDGIASEYQGHNRMVGLSSDDSDTSDE